MTPMLEPPDMFEKERPPEISSFNLCQDASHPNGQRSKGWTSLGSWLVSSYLTHPPSRMRSPGDNVIQKQKMVDKNQGFFGISRVLVISRCRGRYFFFWSELNIKTCWVTSKLIVEVSILTICCLSCNILVGVNQQKQTQTLTVTWGPNKQVPLTFWSTKCGHKWSRSPAGEDDKKNILFV